MQPTMLNVAARSRAYYEWIEDLFRVLDDLEETATACTDQSGASVLGLCRALSAQATRLRVVMNEGRAAGFASALFGEHFAGLADGASALVDRLEQPPSAGVATLPSAATALPDHDPRLTSLLRHLQAARRQLFAHQPDT